MEGPKFTIEELIQLGMNCKNCNSFVPNKVLQIKNPAADLWCKAKNGYCKRIGSEFPCDFVCLLHALNKEKKNE